MEISPDGQLLAACGYQHIRMFDVNNAKPNPVVNFEGVNKNVMSVGFQEEGRWMYTGGEDEKVRLWDLRMRNLNVREPFMLARLSIPFGFIQISKNSWLVMPMDKCTCGI